MTGSFVFTPLDRDRSECPVNWELSLVKAVFTPLDRDRSEYSNAELAHVASTFSLPWIGIGLNTQVQKVIDSLESFHSLGSG